MHSGENFEPSEGEIDRKEALSHGDFEKALGNLHHISHEKTERAEQETQCEIKLAHFSDEHTPYMQAFCKTQILKSSSGDTLKFGNKNNESVG